MITLVRGATPPQPDFYDQLLGRTTAEPLPWESFAHLGPQAAVAADLLRAAMAGREPGINLLLYGPPGTGKTCFAATLAHRVGVQLRAVTEQDTVGGEPSRYERLAGLRLAQRLAPAGETVLLFDEAEDVFVGRALTFDEPAVSSRVFMHRLLEEKRASGDLDGERDRRAGACGAAADDDVRGAGGAGGRGADAAVVQHGGDGGGAAAGRGCGAAGSAGAGGPRGGEHGAAGDAAGGRGCGDGGG